MATLRPHMCILVMSITWMFIIGCVYIISTYLLQGVFILRNAPMAPKAIIKESVYNGYIIKGV